MADSLVTSITNALIHTIPAEVIIFLISMLPILELRGGLIAASLLKVDLLYAFPICVAGNVLPLPFILLFIDKIFAFLKKTRAKKLVEYFEKKAVAKSASVEKHRKWGLFVFVAVPLPGTGGWTGSLIASGLRMKMKEAVPPVILGVLVAGLIMSVVSYTIPSLFF